MKVIDVYNYINSIAPFDSAESWDNSGLLVGDKTTEVSAALVCLDVTREVIEYAKNNNIQLIISHHPVIFSPVKAFLCDDIAYDACRHGISIISAHTNLDKAAGGVNDSLCEALGLSYEKASADVAHGFLNICTLHDSMTAEEFSSYICNKLSASVSYCDGGRLIRRVAVCSGSGADFISDAVFLSCDALLTGDASYHKFLDAKHSSLSLFAAGHYETEIPVVSSLTKKLNNHFNCTVFKEYPSENTVFMVK